MELNDLFADAITVKFNFIYYFISLFLVYGLGALWYSPVLFSEKWASIVNPNFQHRSKNEVSFLPMITQFFSTALLGAVIFIGVNYSIGVSVLFLVAAAGWLKSSLFFKYPNIRTFITVALIEVGYFALASIIWLIFALM